MSGTQIYPSTLQTELMLALKHYAKKLGIPKSRIIEKALEQNIEQLIKEEYIIFLSWTKRISYN